MSGAETETGRRYHVEVRRDPATGKLGRYAVDDDGNLMPPIGEDGQAGIDYVSGREAEAMGDKFPGEPVETFGEPTEFDRRAAAMHMALRLNEIRGYSGVSIVEKLIEEADKIHAFLQGDSA